MGSKGTSRQDTGIQRHSARVCYTLSKGPEGAGKDPVCSRDGIGAEPGMEQRERQTPTLSNKQKVSGMNKPGDRCHAALLLV